jgi:hypothetical protein
VNAEAVEGDECRGEEEGGDSDQDRTVGALQSVPQLSVMRQLSVSDGVVGRGCGAGRRAAGPNYESWLAPSSRRRTVYLRFSGELQLHPPRGQVNLRGGRPVYLEVSGGYEVANQDASHSEG